MQLRTLTLLGLVLVCVGCGPQSIYDKTVSVNNDEITPIEFGPFKKESSIAVDVSSVGPPVTVYVHPKDKTEHVDYAISYGKEPTDVLAGSSSVEIESYQVTVPPDTEVVVRLQGTAQEVSQVSLKITK